jgi:hypothetical protein
MTASAKLKGGRATAADPLALLTLALGQDELVVSLFDGLLEQAALQDLSAGLDGGFHARGKSASFLVGMGSSRVI